MWRVIKNLLPMADNFWKRKIGIILYTKDVEEEIKPHIVHFFIVKPHRKLGI